MINIVKEFHCIQPTGKKKAVKNVIRYREEKHE